MTIHPEDECPVKGDKGVTMTPDNELEVLARNADPALMFRAVYRLFIEGECASSPEEVMRKTVALIAHERLLDMGLQDEARTLI